MSLWQSGMHCVCLRDQWEFIEAGLRTGSVYLIHDVQAFPKGTRTDWGFIDRDVVGLSLDGFEEDIWFDASDFRPLSETRLDQFREHLNRIPADRVPA